MAKSLPISPVLKWVGGKRQLLPVIIPHVPKKMSQYVEPFVGGGAVLFHMQPKNAIASDSNEELINVYRTIKEKPEELIAELQEHEKRNSESYYYEVRALDRAPEYAKRSEIQKAARIIYLNKTCYNGLYRVNSAGQFNSPYGRYVNPSIVNSVGIRSVSKFLNENQITLKCCDYKETLVGLDKKAFVYLDPPYMPISSSAYFTGYTEGGFNYDKQVELKRECDRLRNAGIRFLLSNSDCEAIRDLYSDYTIETVQARRSINSNALRRGETNEVLIYYGR